MHACVQGAAAAEKLPATPTSAYRPGAFDASAASAGLPVQAPLPAKPAKKWFSFGKGSNSKCAHNARQSFLTLCLHMGLFRDAACLM